MKWFYLILACLLTACSAPPAQRTKAEPIILLWSEKTITKQQASQWASEANRRAGPNPVVLVCHGGTVDSADHKHPEWYLFPDAPRKPMRVDDVAWVLRNVFPSRELVIVACNEGGFGLTAPNVLYSRRIVYCTPRRFSLDPMGLMRRHDWADGIEDFTETTPRVKLSGER